MSLGRDGDTLLVSVELSKGGRHRCVGVIGASVSAEITEPCRKVHSSPQRDWTVNRAGPRTIPPPHHGLIKAASPLGIRRFAVINEAPGWIAQTEPWHGPVRA